MTSPIKILNWDSRIFDRRIARLSKPHLTPALVRSAVKACSKQRVDCLYFLTPSDDPSSIRCAEAHGFHLADIRVTLRREIDSFESLGIASSPRKVTYRSARPSDIRALQRLVKNMFGHSRFALDPGFPSHTHDKLFTRWIAKSVRHRFDDWVGVAESRGRLAGFISCRHLGNAAGVIGLIGVAPAFRRYGIGPGLLSQGFDWFRAQKIRHISVVTQGRAIDAQRFYQKYGFSTHQVDLWYHKWF